MGKGNRETVREWVDTVEEDLALGPIVQEEIFSHFFGADAPADSEADEVHILVSVYKYRVFVAQYDTCGQVWDLFGDAFHEIPSNSRAPEPREILHKKVRFFQVCKIHRVRGLFFDKIFTLLRKEINRFCLDAENRQVWRQKGVLILFQ
mgnify:CR=1 FL=1